MMGLELQLGDSFFIDEQGYRQLVFKVTEKNDVTEKFVAQLDMAGLPPLERQFGYGINVLRVHDVDPL